jgi:hypothetical protein
MSCPSQFEKELSAMNAAVINDAYKMLKKPNTRVKYLVRTSLLLSSNGCLFISDLWVDE